MSPALGGLFTMLIDMNGAWQFARYLLMAPVGADTVA